MKLSLLLFLSISTALSSCNGQSANQHVEPNNLASADTVAQIGENIMVIYQDQKKVYWFGSWETGLYRYDGKNLLNFTTKHGLPSNRIDAINEDEAGNLYIVSYHTEWSVTKFDGKTFTALSPVASDDWQLNPSDLWFRHTFDNENFVYRYDGSKLHQLTLPHPPDLPNPFAVYSIYKDRKGNVWFGSNPVGVCRYDGHSFEWITEEDVTEFRNEGANGVRSITEDTNGDFWFNTEFKYGIYDSTTLESNAFYTRHKSIGGLDGKKDSNLDEFLSTVRDNAGNLWFVTYLDGVWKYDGTAITHYPIQVKSKQIELFSIYKDRNGDLWLGTHKNGVYKFNGTTFEKFHP